jgi:hypothetical protein
MARAEDNLTEAFAEWMKSDLGYTTVKRNVKVHGKSAEKPYTVDILGEQSKSIVGVFVKSALISVISLVVLARLYPRDMSSVSRHVESTVMDFVPGAAGWGFAILVGACMAVVFAALRRRATSHAWVDCTGHRNKHVSRNDVMKLHGAVTDFKNTPNAWRSMRVIMVSGTDFDQDALNIANQNGIECYRRSGEKFERRK